MFVLASQSQTWGPVILVFLQEPMKVSYMHPECSEPWLVISALLGAEAIKMKEVG